MKRKSGIVRSSTVQRLKNRVSVLSIRVRELEEAMGHAQDSIEALQKVLHRVVQNVTAIPSQDALELAEEILV